MRVAIAGANTSAPARAEAPFAMRTSYLKGEREAWRSGVTSYAKVRYEQVLPGIDVVYHGAGEQFEFDFVVRPGADPHNITMRYDGQDGLATDNDGNLVVRVGGERLVQHLPVIYQKQGD
ncbi:MAG: hypothetical protein HY269_01365 [Deltaproteobacteria bacterium]|nr:hypothetical protein [Deltaproteobacteria bacterium]